MPNAGEERLCKIVQWITAERKRRLIGAAWTVAASLVFTVIFGILAAIWWILSQYFSDYDPPHNAPPITNRTWNMHEFRMLIGWIILSQMLIGLIAFMVKEYQRRKRGEPFEGKLAFGEMGLWLIITGPVMALYFLWELKLFFWLNEENRWRAAEIIARLADEPDNEGLIENFAIGGMSIKERVYFFRTLGQFGWVRVSRDRGSVDLDSNCVFKFGRKKEIDHHLAADSKSDTEF